MQGNQTSPEREKESKKKICQSHFRVGYGANKPSLRLQVINACWWCLALPWSWQASWYKWECQSRLAWASGCLRDACRCPAVHGSSASMLKCVKVANARDQSSLLSERWDSVLPPLPPVSSRKMDAEQNERGWRLGLFLKWNELEIYILYLESKEKHE